MIRQRARKFLPLVPVVLLLLFAVWTLATPYLPFTRFQVAGEQEIIRDTARSIENAVEANRTLADSLSLMRMLRSTAMALPPAAAGVVFREHIEQATSAAGLRSRTLGVTRTSEPAPGVVLFEIAFSADGQTGEMANFLASLYSGTPRMFWKNLTIKPNSIANPEYITISGTLSALSFTGPETVVPTAAEEESL